MKKISYILMMAVMFLNIFSCSKANGNDSKQQENNNAKVNNNTNTSGKKILIAYFSRPGENYSVGVVKVGSTELVANHIKNYLGNRADVFKIEPTEAYPQGYEDTKTRATREKTNNERPTFKGNVDISQYDTIFIGYPIWWADAPMIIETFLEKYDFTGKTIIPFNTHQGSGNAGSYSHIKSKMTSTNVNTNGLAVSGTDARTNGAKNTVEKWLKGLGY